MPMICSPGRYPDVGDAEERQRVVLAEGRERDRAFDHEAAAALDRERGQQLRVALVAGGRLEQRAQEPLRRVAGTRRVEVHAERLEDLGDVAAKALPVGRRDLALRQVRPRVAQRVELDHVVPLHDFEQ